MEMNSFTSVRPWMEQILVSIKKDIKTDHLSVDKAFFKEHFGTRPMNKLTQEEIFSCYEKELLAGNEQLCEWVVNRWVFKHGDIYQYFVKRLSEINPNFQEIQLIAEDMAQDIIKKAIESFGTVDTYIFSRLNAVAFSKSVLDDLHQKSLKETEDKKAHEEQKNLDESLSDIKLRHQREVTRLQEKYEDKIQGVLRKYTTDVEALKNQIRALQKSGK